MKNKNAQEMSKEQMRELGIRMLSAIPMDMSADTAQGWIENPGLLARVMRKALTPDSEFLDEYRRFYKEIFNRNANLPKAEGREGYWMIAIDKGLTLNEAYAAGERNFKCWKYADNLDKSVTQNDRTSAQSYVVFVKATVEADVEFKNMSADQLKDKGINGITLLERIVLELFYFWKTSWHLDIYNMTLCSGSRNADGFVPYVNGYGDGVYVHYYSPDNAGDGLRSRSVVS